ncbi:MAG: hypothetical protein JWO76_2052 [Nocardioides sp.]|nr:hypothetical protein [Nocardioides sp.]
MAQVTLAGGRIPVVTTRAPVWAALALVLGACGGPGRTPPPEVAPTAPRTIVVTPIPVPPGVHLSFVQQRIDEGTHRAQIRVVNGTGRSLHVRSVSLDWPGYPEQLQRVDYDVPAGQTVDLRYRLPPAVCAAAVDRAPMVGVAVTDRGVLRRALTDDGVRFLTRIHGTTCQARLLDAAATVSYGDRWRPASRDGRPVLLGLLVLTRPGDEGAAGPAVGVTQIEGSVLFDLSLPEGGDAMALPPARRRVALPLLVRDGGRCDPHSRGQSTQTFLFRAFLSLDGGPGISRLVPPSRAQQRLLLRFLDRVCSTVER